MTGYTNLINIISNMHLNLNVLSVYYVQTLKTAMNECENKTPTDFIYRAMSNKNN